MAEDWLKLYRKLAESELWLREKFSRGQAWIDLLLLARWKKGHARIRGVRVDLEPGQLAWSEVELAKRWQWNRRTVSKFLEELEQSAQQITQQKNNVTTVITLTNWLWYQAGYTANYTAECTAECTANPHILPDSAGSESSKKGEEGKEEEKSTLPSSLRLSEPKRAFSEPAQAPAQKKPAIEQTHPRLHQVSKSFLQAQQRQHPAKIKSIPEKKVRSGADTLRLLTERDGYDLDWEIIPALQWAIKDEFWTYQVLSLASLRKPGRNGEMKFVNILASKEKQEKQEPGRMSDDMLNMLDEWNQKHEQRRRDNGGSGGNGSEHRNGDDGMGYEFQITDEAGGDPPISKDVGKVFGEIPRY